MSYQEIKKQKRNPNYVQPINDYRLGWLAFAEGAPIEECETDEMALGWTQALRDCANADAGTIYA